MKSAGQYAAHSPSRQRAGSANARSAIGERSVIIVVADGARPDTLASAMDSGALPALARLRDEGGLHVVSSCFPSVTGPAYAPFLMGRFPGPVGLPGLRWFDRARTTASFPHFTRSYVGAEMRHVDADLDTDAPTLFELVRDAGGGALAALNVIGRGTTSRQRLGRSLRFILRAAATHFRGNVAGWLDIDREIGAEVRRRVREERPSFVFCALTGIDKASHSVGHDSPLVLEAMRIVDDTVAGLREDAERDGRWNDTRLWIVSDHGHSPVHQHEDLQRAIDGMGFSTLAHPMIYSRGRDVAVMVSGNAMAHLYLDLAHRSRRWWPHLDPKWHDLAHALVERPSVDLMLLPRSPNACEVHGRGRGMALAIRTVEDGQERFDYQPRSGDPLGIGLVEGVDANDALAACEVSDYPDAIVQIAHLARAPRSSEIILSASREWDFRARYEPIPHVSSHGALHREHMLVPLLVSHPIRGEPLRTVDVMPSALEQLGVEVVAGLDGESFV